MNWTRSCSLLPCLLALSVVAARAQTSNEPPVVRPHRPGASKPAPRPPAVPMLADLLVSCDLPCSFTFDGEAGGRMDADGSVKVKAGAGQHLVVATAEGSTDRVVKEVSLELAHQTLLRVDLGTVREARLLAEKKQSPPPPVPQPPSVLPAEGIPGLETYVTAQSADEQKCLAGNAATCDTVAANYRNGRGVATDRQRAAFYYASACRLKMADACNHLGDLYAMDLHDTANARRAYSLAILIYQPECDAGSSSSCSFIGNIYSYSGSGLKDDQKASAAYQQACKAGNRSNCSH